MNFPALTSDNLCLSLYDYARPGVSVGRPERPGSKKARLITRLFIHAVRGTIFFNLNDIRAGWRRPIYNIDICHLLPSPSNLSQI